MNVEEKPVNKVWLAVIVGLLIATAPTWATAEHKKSNYDAPWIYPGNT